MSKDQIRKNEAAHETHVRNWALEKKKAGEWLPKKDYEKKTGQPGRAN